MEKIKCYEVVNASNKDESNAWYKAHHNNYYTRDGVFHGIVPLA